MEIEKIWWKETSRTKYRELVQRNLSTNRKKGIKFADMLRNGVQRVKEQPYVGFQEPSLIGYPMQIRFFNLDNSITIIYYIEEDSLYIVDLWEDALSPKGKK